MRRMLALAGVPLLFGAALAGGGTPAAAEQAPQRVLEVLEAAESQHGAGASLQEALVGLGDALGVADAAAAVDLSGLSEETSEVLARLVESTAACARLSSLFDDRARSPERAECAARLRATAEMAGSAVANSEDLPVDVWPLLRFQPGAGDDTYVHDYAVLVDAGGNDLYDNNAGGNLLDHVRGPDNSAARKKAPAVGCENAIGAIPSSCIAGAAVLVDAAGNDTYGVVRPPSAIDSPCTSEPLVRRIGTAGAAVGGVGVLVDLGGNDQYLGKTLTQGAGHLGGVGVLHDLAGNDEYSAIRTAQGAGVLGGLGVLLDDRGNDHYGFYSPAGGLWELRPPNLRSSDAICDDGIRQLQGAATLGGSGVLLDRQGNDTHVVDFPAVRLFGLVDHDAPSLGAATLGGTASFDDLGGRDLYLDPSGMALEGRGDGVTTTHSGATVATGVGVFHDSGR